MQLLRAAAKNLITVSNGFDWDGYQFFSGKPKENLSLTQVLRLLGYDPYFWEFPAPEVRVLPFDGDHDDTLFEGSPQEVWNWLRDTGQINW